ncbi:hypothetical protein [Ponticoccus alexandrii]|uniref:Uncharacterized protein n=1 Tax=Ponticoccus alexandrii TaxID=1943633 RepID=A0ABX7F9V0_9RHOB|nr:hypothetical protein [Ponticoccus alexandrii]QRF67264.1 hypothetical protein GQA70_13675 [Ponticoccus alexandrii]
MASIWDITSGLGKIAARKAAGDYYQQGFNDARAGKGKSPKHIENVSMRAAYPDTKNGQVYDILIDAYEQGYRDGIEREEMEVRRDQWRRYDPRD